MKKEKVMDTIKIAMIVWTLVVGLSCVSVLTGCILQAHQNGGEVTLTFNWAHEIWIETVGLSIAFIGLFVVAREWFKGNLIIKYKDVYI